MPFYSAERKAALLKIQSAENWSAEYKLTIIIETGWLSELEIGEYCRRKGILPEQIIDWHTAFIASSMSQSTARTATSDQSRDDKNRIRELECEWHPKDAALAEKQQLCWYCEKWGERRRGQQILWLGSGQP